MDDAEFARVYGSKERVEWMQGLPSVATGKGPCVCAHIRHSSGGGGTGRKADFIWTVPLTYVEHQQLHQRGASWFHEEYGLDQDDLDTLARVCVAAWEKEQARRTTGGAYAF
jgi:hypothetical protein